MKLPIRSVFICLRPEIFGHPNEHVTLEYMGHEPELEEITTKSAEWLNRFGGLPVTVRVNGYANWQSQKLDYHSVALVMFNEYPALSYSKNWHITLESDNEPVEPKQFDAFADAFRYDICDRLWVGYTDAKGEKRFQEPTEFFQLRDLYAK